MTCRSEIKLSERSVDFLRACFPARCSSVACLTFSVAVSHFQLWEPILIASVGGLIPGFGIRHCRPTDWLNYFVASHSESSGRLFLDLLDDLP